MTLPSADEGLLKRYLLGTVTDAARQDLEARLFSDDRILWERLTIAEDELISDYVQNALTPEERRDFESHFVCTNERRAKLEFARALHAHATRAGVPRESAWTWLRRPVLSPAWAVAAAALLLLVVQLPRFGSGDADEEVRGVDVVAVSLSAGRMRAVGGELPRVRLNTNSRIVRLQLEPESTRFPAYRAAVYHVDGDGFLAEVMLTPPSGGSSELTLALPAELLAEGDYYVRLQGIPAGAAPEPLQRYDFRVLRD